MVILLLATAQRPGQAQEVEVSFQVEVVGGVPDKTVGNVTGWIVDVPLPVPEFVDVEVEVVLVSRVAACVDGPANCSGTENIVTQAENGIPLVFGCSDGVDNDDNGLTDLEDPDCVGVSHWTLSVAVEDKFGLNDATTNGTAGGLILSPPGLRDLQSGEHTILVDPSENDGQQGVTSAVTLSLTNDHALAPVSDSVVLRITGRIATTGLETPGDTSEPVGVEIVDPALPGLVRPGFDPPRLPTTFLLNGIDGTRIPEVLNATIRLRVESESPAFRRGDANTDGEHEITDGIFIVNYLFLGKVEPTCRDAADTNDDGDLDTSDAISLFEYLFLGGTVPPSPGPGLCGPDDTEDALTCESFAGCP
jgi:hypothetical protein